MTRSLFVAFGAGFTSGAAAITWTADPACVTSRRWRRAGRHPSTRPSTGMPGDPVPPRLAAVLADKQTTGGARMIDLSGKSAVVTGGSRGIGRAIALRLAQQGADVAFSYKGNAAAAADTLAAIEAFGRRGLAIQADVADPDAADALIKEALAVFGKVDILVNNAGITRDDLIMRMGIDAWKEVIDTNLSGAFYATKAVTRPMLKARGGRIINITSVSGQAGQMGQANYSSAKAGLIGLTKATARELASRGITVNAVAPGFVVTELTQDLPQELKDELIRRTPLGRFGETDGDRGRGRVPGLGRGRLHHGPGARRRRRPGDDVVRPAAAGRGRAARPADRAGQPTGRASRPGRPADRRPISGDHRRRHGQASVCHPRDVLDQAKPTSAPPLEEGRNAEAPETDEHLDRRQEVVRLVIAGAVALLAADHRRSACRWGRHLGRCPRCGAGDDPGHRAAGPRPTRRPDHRAAPLPGAGHDAHPPGAVALDVARRGGGGHRGRAPVDLGRGPRGRRPRCAGPTRWSR